jgi:hypothetical protein
MQAATNESLKKPRKKPRKLPRGGKSQTYRELLEEMERNATKPQGPWVLRDLFSTSTL